MPMQINAVERATVVAALRLYQRELDVNRDLPPSDLFMTATARGRWEPLNGEAVEKLIARIAIFEALQP